MANGVTNPDIVGQFLRGRQAKQQNELFQQQLAGQRQKQQQLASQQQLAGETRQLSGQILSGEDVDNNLKILFQKNPEAAQGVLTSLGINNQRKADEAADFAFKLRNVPFEQRADKINERVQFLDSQNRPSSDTAELLNLNQQQQDNALRVVEQASLSVKGRQQAALKPQELALKEEGIRLRKQESDLRRSEIEERNLDRQLTRETNEVKREELKQKLEVKKTANQQAKRDREFNAQSSIDAVQGSVDTIDRLLEGQSLERAAGFEANFPTIKGTEASDFEATLDTLQSQAFLSQVEKMKGLGALSENEGKKLGAALGTLTTDLSDKALRAELTRVRGIISKAKDRMEKKFNIKPQVNLTTLSDDDLLDF